MQSLSFLASKGVECCSEKQLTLPLPELLLSPYPVPSWFVQLHYTRAAVVSEKQMFDSSKIVLAGAMKKVSS